MKTRQRRICLLLAAALLCMTAMLASCSSGRDVSGTEPSENSASGEMIYKVTVKDALGNPYSSGIVVQFMQNGEKVAMQACDENGVAEKALTAGEYTVVLGFADAEGGYHYEENQIVSAEKNELEVVLAQKLTSEPQVLYVQSSEYGAYPVAEGCTYVDLTAGRNYFLFTPTKAGNYEFSITDGANVQIGYYGAPHFVQENSAAEVTENKFTVSVSASMIGSGDSGTTTLVIGVDAPDETVKNCVIGIARIGEALKTIEDEPWIIYETTAALSAYQLPSDAQIKEFDLTASTDTYPLVYNEEDGFYHLHSASGPLVLVRLTEDCEYIACFQTMLDRSGVSKYFYDEDGVFEKKESYSECLMEYFEYADESEGVYPLTKDLEYIIKQRGEYVGWWDAESDGYLFKDANNNNDLTINCEIAWLLMCCYIE